MHRPVVACRRLATLAMAALLALTGPAAAQDGGLRLIRDAEVENTIRAYADPIFKVAGYNPQDIRVFLVADSRLNAFVAGGLNMFMNTGTLTRAKDAGEVIGVIAHETGHIYGGHLTRMHDRISSVWKEMALTYLAGIAAAVATGRSDVGSAVVAGGAGVTTSNILAFSRAQESQADQAGLRFLDQAGISAEGLLDFFETLEGIELMAAARRDPYLTTHPLTRKRIATVRRHVETSPVTEAKLPERFNELHARMQAKLVAFMEPEHIVLRRYPLKDKSLAARYAHAIMYYRRPDLPKALAEIDALIAERPKDPYFHELKGQILFENGRIGAAVEPYRAAIRLLPGNPLLQTNLAQVLTETNDPALLPEAIQLLETAHRAEPDSPLTLRLLSVAYGRNGDIGMAALYIAEAAMQRGEYKQAIQQAERALRELPPGSPGRRLAEDIKRDAEYQDK